MTTEFVVPIKILLTFEVVNHQVQISVVQPTAATSTPKHHGTGGRWQIPFNSHKEQNLFTRARFLCEKYNMIFSEALVKAGTTLDEFKAKPKRQIKFRPANTLQIPVKASKNRYEYNKMHNLCKKWGGIPYPEAIAKEQEQLPKKPEIIEPAQSVKQPDPVAAEPEISKAATTETLHFISGQRVVQQHDSSLYKRLWGEGIVIEIQPNDIVKVRSIGDGLYYKIPGSCLKIIDEESRGKK
jgi:hypothetical protein